MKYLLLVFAVTFSFTVMAQSVQWRDQHKVKRRETVFGIAKEYGISIQQLIDANPVMKQTGYELKKGDLIFVPFAKEETSILMVQWLRRQPKGNGEGY